MQLEMKRVHLFKEEKVELESRHESTISAILTIIKQGS